MKNLLRVIVASALLLFGASMLYRKTVSSASAAPGVSSKSSGKMRRTILMSFKPEATQAQIDQVLGDVRENISEMKGIHNLFIGKQINERAPFQYGISMDFEDEAAFKAYRQNEGHHKTHNDYVHLIDKTQISDIVE